LNILHCESSPGWGGQEIRILKESIGLVAKGHSVFMAVAKDGGLVQKARDSGFIVYEINYKKAFWIISFFRLIKIILTNKIDIVNTHSSDDAWLCGLVCRLLGRKVVRTRHLSTKVRGGLNSILLYNKLTDYTVTTCKSIIPMLYKQSKKDKRCFSSIPTGLQPESIKIDYEKKEEFLKKLDVKKEDTLVGVVCFMRSWKGIVDFLKAAQILKNESNIKWVIIGGGHIQTYQKIANDLGLSKKVHFTNHLERPYYAIDAIDIFVLLSTDHEGVSQASLQAAYLQKPLITTDIGGLPEVCINNKTGILVPSFSPKRVADGILKLRNNPDLAKEFGKNAKQLVLEQFTFDKMITDMEKIYSSI
jgi:glycosyltransferase involved in cell wall biosynthesis